MKRSWSALVVTVLLGLLLAVGCSQAAPTAPTAALAAPTKTAAEPTKAAAPAAAPTAAPAQPTAAPAAPKVNYPEKGKAITLLVPFAAGGSTDLATRVLAPMLEKDLGVPVQVVNKAGATNQVAAQDLVISKPDGYTFLMFAIPTTLITYLDPERQATYGRKDFLPVATAFADGLGIVVKADSPFKTLKDVVDAAKAKPGEVTVSTAGLKGLNHLGALAFEQVAGVKFTYVHFNSGTEAITAALGDHVQVATATLGNVRSQVKSGAVRVLGIMDSQPNDLLPGAPTLDSQGYKVYAAAGYIVTAQKDTPKEIASIMDAAVKKATTSDEFKQKISEIGMSPKYMNAEQAAAYWTEQENWTKPLLALAK
jgi:tripartite-type tricarboxylate transporter receptor subunit TctC